VAHTLRGIGVALVAGIAVFMGFSAPSADAVEPSNRSMVVGNLTSQPIGHYDFCKRHFDECNVRSQPTLAPKVTDFGWDVVREVNVSVNSAIMPRTDLEMHGIEEYWSYPVTEGDCEDYALLKRLMLLERGFAASDLLLTVVRKRDGEGHAVLTLRTAEGDFILDNLDNEVRLWTDTPYTFLKRQASFHTGRWVSIENSTDVLVGALN
jgi:predicted transglutaminase-like cysteine proteinase